MKLGKRLRALRQERGLSQEQLAERSGLSRVTVSALERDENQPAGGTIEKLGQGLELYSLSALVEDARVSETDDTSMSKADAQNTLGIASVPLFESSPSDLLWNVDSPECEGEFYLLRDHLKRAGCVVLRIHGMMMWPNYLDGDLVLVDTTRRNAHSREVVIARYGGTLGVFRFRREGRRTFLRHDDPVSKSIEIVNRDDLVIGGIVIALVWREGSTSVS